MMNIAEKPQLTIPRVIGCLSFFNADNLEIMRGFKDKEFDLAIVDPPYGIDMSQELFKRGKTCKKNGYKEHLDKDWDKQVPTKEYFNELFRISKNQIVFGANYMTKYLPESMGWIVWNKVQRDFSFADGELAWTSFKQGLKIFDYARGNESGFAPKLKGTERAGINIHPTQKPIALYDWIFANYSERGQIILETYQSHKAGLQQLNQSNYPKSVSNLLRNLPNKLPMMTLHLTRYCQNAGFRVPI